MRYLVVGILLGLLTVPTQAEMGEDGLHKQSWFSITFKDIAEDIAEAAEDNKRLALIFEQKGCIYCEKLHETLLSDPEISEYIQKHFNVVQLNMFGDEEVTDLDGEVITEKQAVEKWGVMFTPLILFMPDKAPVGNTDAAQAAVAVMPGAFGKLTFLNMFKWVQQKGYEGDEHFQQYHARNIAELKSSGQTIEE